MAVFRSSAGYLLETQNPETIETMRNSEYYTEIVGEECKEEESKEKPVSRKRKKAE